MPLREARFTRPLPDGRLECSGCPRACRLRDGQPGACGARMRRGESVALLDYGRTSGLCVDPIEKKPLYHFLPGTRTLSFGTRGCTLACRFCQNWHMSRPRATVPLEPTSPEAIAEAAVRAGCASVAFTYNEPVVFAEFAIDVARACRARGVRTVAVTNGWVEGEARHALFGAMDAANVDLKALDDGYYRQLCAGSLAPVLGTLRHLRRETAVWVEVTNLLLSGENDEPDACARLAAWVARELGPHVPVHFTAFRPAHRLQDRPPTPAASLTAARSRAIGEGLRHVYTGNVSDPEGSATRCHSCGQALVERMGFRVVRDRLGAGGSCPRCGTSCAGVWA
ncbi:MAG TPA: AmmeMemoRadiSam system radical SAM enzyme [Chthonomonadales bacterium]|nr:AmmeMemoRadiSam system radical SAM enzyme [Chthonomonadales bacterium]